MELGRTMAAIPLAGSKRKRFSTPVLARASDHPPPAEQHRDRTDETHVPAARPPSELFQTSNQLLQCQHVPEARGIAPNIALDRPIG